MAPVFPRQHVWWHYGEAARVCRRAGGLRSQSRDASDSNGRLWHDEAPPVSSLAMSSRRRTLAEESSAVVTSSGSFSA